MKKIFAEKNVVVILFVLVLVVFSFAQRDTEKLFDQYNHKSTVQKVISHPDLTSADIKKVRPAPAIISE